MKSLRTLLGTWVVALFAASCTFDGDRYPQSSVHPTSDFAEMIHGLYVDIFWWTLGILVVVWAVLAYILVRFRARPDQPIPKQIHGHMGLEIGWTVLPALIVVAITIPTIQAVFSTQTANLEESLVIDVIGHQYWWEFRYPDTGMVTANEVHIPVGQQVSFRLSSADVIHSFWVPMLGGKRDANPVRVRPEGLDPEYNWIHLTANETGTFWGQCAEFCGDSHSLMGFRVVVESPEEFDAWQAQLAEPVVAPEVAAAEGDSIATPVQVADVDPLVEEGRTIFHQQTCVACHAIQGTNAQGEIAPNLTLLGQRSSIAAGWLENTPENLERWITAPQDIKPGVLMPGVNVAGGNWPATNLTEDQVRAVAAYLYSLR
ncbi:cytochrome c oxidase subunit II [Gaopeijia maritima]|uniref:Cytochrome c oxidase subunit 2 n=1 Tax=Gaopeijia maritima TaxID=3119007 RepID=A0ABU9E4Z7_9BACT